ncbi:hypothetical protein AMAG_15665 [Allomyces macrogynus ATCC 38327]|uniref:Uncharacterized protein n=1 Tax=Allomyces macrogynus (strain ATCC 38327) TaxID=578462 RepID=A0A0L0T9M4_ALLM3|nr:hypothetical protein AMAG_15665 [Allomyces macrogynus ATCC 38327]|eukprot:KNE71431.1 hypothetical protein AMAG_15665 [Allomyces macrogynus ATCC 38327]
MHVAGTAKRDRIVKEARVARLPPTVAPTAILLHPTVLAKLVEVTDKSLPQLGVGVMPSHPLEPTVTFTEPTVTFTEPTVTFTELAPTSATTTSPTPLPATRSPLSRHDGLPASRSLGGRRAAALPRQGRRLQLPRKTKRKGINRPQWSCRYLSRPPRIWNIPQSQSSRRQ